MSEKVKYPIPKDTFLRKYRMVGWYNVRQLAVTGIKTVISDLFGSYADRRETQAAISGNECFEYKDEDLWFDYVADLGDGFDSTFSIASLLSSQELTINSMHTKRGRFLIMGGDEVYPYAKREYYQERLVNLYEVALPENKDDKSPPHLYAIPGNHDWYDGLSNFLKIFCQKRSIGNWRTIQHRSYFAIQISKGLWIWGIDIQLDADIDKPQLDYFENISNKMDKGCNIILCTAEPSWMTANERKNISYHNLKFFEDHYIVAKGFDLIVSIAGDQHHYARYEASTEKGLIHKITAGGGGAFLHPTHNLSEEVEKIREGKICLRKTFPDKKNSFKLLFLNFIFPFTNSEFSLFLGSFYLIFSWFLQSASIGAPILSELSNLSPKLSNIIPAFEEIVLVILYNPSLLVINLSILMGTYAFADKNRGRRGLITVLSFLHGTAHIVNGLVLIWILSYFNFGSTKGYNIISVSYFSLEMLFIGGFSGGFILGIYLILSNILGLHNNEAFSALKYEGYKNFIRFHLKDKRLTIYPIGVRKITRWKVNREFVEGELPQVALIEDPIVIEV